MRSVPPVICALKACRSLSMRNFRRWATIMWIPSRVRIGPYAREPYDHAAFFNISAMSFGALSAPAVRALSIGAAKAGIWLDTGEGGLAPYHLKGGCDLVFEIGTAKYGVRTADGKLDDGKLLAICATSR